MNTIDLPAPKTPSGGYVVCRPDGSPFIDLDEREHAVKMAGYGFIVKPVDGGVL